MKKYKQCEFEVIDYNKIKEIYVATYKNDITFSNTTKGYDKSCNKNHKHKILVFLMYYAECYRGHSAPWEIEGQYPNVTKEEFYKIEKFMGGIRWNI